MTPKQLKILRNAVASIMAKPKKFKMEYLFEKVKGCGTVCCLAGQICLNAGYKPLFSGGRDTATEVKNGEEIEGVYVAQDLLGLNNREAERMFYTYFWPSPFDEDYRTATSAMGRAESLRDRVEHFIQTGE